MATHEAGHATSSLLGSLKGAQLSFVTIVPRMDGSLGFVASVPRDGEVLTRRSMMEQLETVLAGRAAEEMSLLRADLRKQPHERLLKAGNRAGRAPVRAIA